MTNKHSHLFSLFLLICACLLVNCKSDTKDNGTNEAVKTQTTAAVIETSLPLKSEVPENKEDNTKSDTSEVNPDTSLKTSEPNKDSDLPINNTTKPNQTKPNKAPTKEKYTKTTSYKKAKIHFEELTWNFGEITEGDIIEKKFKFTNTGDVPLKIKATSATCGCTRPSFPFLDIAPGDSHFIGVTYNSVGKDGEQNPEVTVESNTNPKITIIKLHGNVVPKAKKEEKQESEVSIKDSTAAKQ